MTTEKAKPFKAAVDVEVRRAVMRKIADRRRPNEAEEEARRFDVEYFQGDEQKAEDWLTTPNPMLGNERPRDLLRLGRHQQVLRFIRAAKQQRRRDG